MPLLDINHVAIRTLDLDKTNKFYTEVLGMQFAKRPPMDFPGSWLQIGEGTMIHVLAGNAAYDIEGKYRPVGGSVDHISIGAKGFDDFVRRFEDAGLDWREFALPEAGIMQLFVRDPNGILIELNFSAKVENREPKKVTGERMFQPGAF
ncbi:MAG: VOC family protein [Rhodospirillaceae bacterium]|nr:VOC family protein [Rhodospirillaceae bacterium]